MRVGIVGAGIGGLVAAAALQSDGHGVTVHERRSDAGAVGAGLTLFENAFTALDAVGLGDSVRAVSSTAIGRMRSGQRQPSGRWLVSLPRSATSSIRSLHRADLHRILLDHLEPGTLHLGQAAAVSSDGAPTLQVNGREGHFDLIIAADGLRSAARTRWGLDRGLRYAGYTAWRGVAGSSAHLTDGAGETWGRGARFGIVPLSDERTYWFATHSVPPGGADADAREALHGLFGSWHAPITDLIEATDPHDILRHDIYDLARFPSSFVHRRGALLGDAAHGMTPDLGQGAGQAIEDAATLALLLRRAGVDDLDHVLARFDRLRRTRTRGIWSRSRLMGRVAQNSNPVISRLRDSALRATPPRLMASGVTRLQQWEPVR